MLKIGVVGTGHMGRYHVNILSTIANSNKIKFNAICDINEEVLRKLSIQYNVQYYTDYNKFLNHVDAVIIAVPTYLHYKFASIALEKGKHVLLEKPITKTVYYAEKLFNKSIQKNLILQIGHVERFNAAVQELENVVKKPIFIQAQRLGPKSRITDVGVVLDLMIHDIDIVLSLAKSEVYDIQSHGSRIYSNYEDVANASIYFENGVIANVAASRVSQNKIRTLSISEEDCFIHLDYATQDLTIYRHPQSEYFVAKEEIKYKQEAIVERVFIHKENALKLEQEHFIDCILNNINPIKTYEDDLKAHRITKNIIEGIYKKWKR